MSASSHPPRTLAHFSENELAMLAKTADALSAYMGKPVLAEVGVSEAGQEWVTFGIPVDVDAPDTDDDAIHVQMGGPRARMLGNRGGLPAESDVVYDCLYLWAIEIVDTEGERFVKLDQDGEASAWSDSLSDVLPFDMSDEGAGVGATAGETLGELIMGADEDGEEEDGEDEDGGGAEGKTEGEYGRNRDATGRTASAHEGDDREEDPDRSYLGRIIHPAPPYRH